jgi:GH25 family lysozyme M1 (1,4-beta-N-acetylmuramidase)
MATYFPNESDVRPFGVDVSRYNTVDWAAVANFGAPPVRFCMVRWGQAFQGAYDDIDRRFFFNWGNARMQQGLEEWTAPAGPTAKRMGYHVFYPGSAVGPQVENVRRIGRLVGNDWGDPPFWIDLELNQGLMGAPIIDRCREFQTGLEDLMGMPVGIYSGKWYIDKYKLPVRPWWSETYWWLAQYTSTGVEDTRPLAIPAGIPPARVLFHQTTSSLEGMLFGAPLGVRVDGNRELNKMT